ncbi:alpha-L-rhamnosidase-related protein [Paenibacillus illinoisensis]|uniref:Alpha-L-rhamnosidase n=1 Tax=Paenibacillus illinoisensis TaxID=59845 RepID=A0A2W0BZR2_9BACL|nr:alpha-rhamnosidase [Paenibacillus illinoisensis]PYY25333.1 Alpha-L-rhamnosidase [Paenibacillus illinoisensis]
MEQEINPNSAVWIWYPGDFEIRLHEKMSVKRKSRDVMYPAFWRLDRHYSNVNFRFTYDLDQEEQIKITSEGTFSLFLDGKENFRSKDSKTTLPAGRHEITVCIFNDAEMPALFIEGQNVYTSSNWEASSYQNDWMQVGSWKFDSFDQPPSRFRLAVTPQEAVSTVLREGHLLLDFGLETFGYLRFHHLKGTGAVNIYYGESMAEVLSTETCYSLDRFYAEEAREHGEDGLYTLEDAKAFRYVWIHSDPDVSWEHVSMLYEYVPLTYHGSFECSDPELNEIYDMSLYTLHLSTREFFLDGIKRDRWVWGGDAYQAFLMNYYSFFDVDVTRRTLVALRGKDPLVKHINTILDYTLYWFISLYDYYLYTGDFEFIRLYYDRAVSLMEFCLKQRNEEGFMEGRAEDWVFVDWADFNNKGAVSTIQLLLVRSLEAMSTFAEKLDDQAAAGTYGKLADEIKIKTFTCFWDHEKGGLLHHRIDGVTKPTLTKHASLFAMTYGYLTQEQRESIICNVLLHPDVPQIRTPYMRFHEMAVLCEGGQHDQVREQILSYWGGMISLGATTFWEEYDPSLADDAHYGMYGMEFGKSLCHAWGAGPVYLLGKYYLGVVPTSPGYETYRVQPNLGGLSHMKGTVPTGKGTIYVEMDSSNIQVSGTQGIGVLVIYSEEAPASSEGDIRSVSGNRYELTIESGKTYTISYRAIAEREVQL